MSGALVLGGGGVAGVAWETGLLTGLLEAGVDVTGADLLVGTSAGSVVAAQITGGRQLAELYDRQVSPNLAAKEIAAAFDADVMMAEFGRIFSSTTPGVEQLRAIGEYALRADTPAESVRRKVIEARLPVHRWPDRDLRIVAIDAATGEIRVFTSADDVELVDAVAASCAVPGVWPPVTIGATRYIDGGIRSTSNADLAAGGDPILVLAPMPELPMTAPDVSERIEALRRGARVLTINPDEAAVAAMGANLLDPATARPSAEAGRAQAAAHVAAVDALWSAGG